ncbi:3'(2'),5'-bisphosphate nucleotidase CysQ [Paracoccus sp. Z118]|uniref:3'(2'),5'-bisphosphate nucleotidase CysQ n=1 Tax=Paracoccus sp. Z118 TaxID=2851017 RepID=UPI001C2C1164|nr:3'(2'),5'-bisphosphate nucleotidase CysQ [Paracoccus sp. Z118]MBV0891965.1 3'(2'),5'-bisphosphate nucleotidase CysQ [Paracoccus sp. Z118]
MPATDLPLLIRAALDAGPIAMRFWRQSPRAWDKGGTLGPVTEADLAVNEHLEEVLRSARPDYGWLSEESADSADRQDAVRCFIIDPIDGTRAFMDGQDGFSHSLAVVDDGRVTAGVVYLPARDLVYAASIDAPATLNDKPMGPTDVRIKGARVLTSRASMQPSLWRGGAVPGFKREFRPSLAWRLCLAGEGRFDAALSVQPCWEWDIAAASLIAAQAGCAVTDMRGHAMRFNTGPAKVPGLVVAGPRLHRQITAALKGGPDDGEEVA